MLRRTFSAYPRQFWLLFTGMLISTSGTSMVWPFLMIYMSGRLGLTRTAAASSVLSGIRDRVLLVGDRVLFFGNTRL